MKFVDEVRIQVKAGDGGNGAVAFRREKYIDRGGPNGGDGGNGGSVIFVADPQLTTLLDYRYQQHHRARSGEGGMGNDCNGRSSDDLILRVPVGTLLRDEATGERLDELEEERRLAYVGITRAEDRLFLTRARGRAGARSEREPSVSWLP